MRRSWMGLVLVAGCATPGSYGRQVAVAQCEAAETCSLASFQESYGSVSECADDLEGLYGGDCYLDNCETFDAKTANECLADLSDEDCDVAASADCAVAWSDCDVIAVGLCLIAEGYGAFIE
jgi:hypothetical protein